MMKTTFVLNCPSIANLPDVAVSLRNNRMTLADIEYKTFLDIHIDFLFFVGQKSKIIDETLSFKKFVGSDFSVKLKCRDFFLDNKQLLDDYFTTNFDKLRT